MGEVQNISDILRGQASTTTTTGITTTDGDGGVRVDDEVVETGQLNGSKLNLNPALKWVTAKYINK